MRYEMISAIINVALIKTYFTRLSAGSYLSCYEFWFILNVIRTELGQTNLKMRLNFVYTYILYLRKDIYSYSVYP